MVFFIAALQQRAASPRGLAAVAKLLPFDQREAHQRTQKQK
jgi:hypothetical protein